MTREKIEAFKQFYNATDGEVRWWAYAGWSVPIIALASLFFVNIIGLESLFNQLIVVGAVSFFSLSVVWWWWAIFKLAAIAKLMLNTAVNLKEIGSELKSINKEIHKEDK